MIKVIDQARNEHHLDDPLARIVILIVENANEIMRTQNSKLIFDLAGRNVKATIQRALEVPRPEV